MKIFYFLILIVAFASINIIADDDNWDRVIIERILSSVSQEETISVNVDDAKLKSLLKSSKKLVFKEYPCEADFLLISPHYDISCDKPAVVFSFKEFRNTPNAIAVFFWQKGRPTIRFSSKRLNYFGLHVSGELEKFVSTRY